MKVIVDMNVCQDYGQCVFAAPKVFQLDDAGHLVYESEPEGQERTSVEEAADACPVQAIRLEG